MRSELHEPSRGPVAVTRRRRWPSPHADEQRTERAELPPCVVDAAFADESLRIRSSRLDHSHGEAGNVAGARLPQAAESEAELLVSLSAQLEMINQQQKEIRRLLCRASAHRLDEATA